MNKKCVLLAGLPSAGKSTFIAALYHLVQDGSLPESLILEELYGINSDHLQKLEGKWLCGDHLDRTYIPDEIRASLSLRDQSTGELIELHIPDISGETYSQQWENRTCNKDFISMIDEVTGILLFIHPHTDKATSILSANKLVRILDSAETDIHQCTDENNFTGSCVTEWDAKTSPTSVKLVEILQFISEQLDRKMKLAIIISAWDLVASMRVQPNIWLQQRLPLLYQYLSTNDDIFQYKIYGISALGGDLDADKKDLLSKSPIQRIIVVEDDLTTSDITLPLKWLLK